MSRSLTSAEILLVLEGDEESLVDRTIHGGNGCSFPIEVHHSDSSEDERCYVT